MEKFELTHARHDPWHCLAPGLFRSLQRGERRRAKLHVVYSFGDGNTIEFSGPEPLGADDLRVLQGLVAMAGPAGIPLDANPRTDEGKRLRKGLDLSGDLAEQQDGVVVKGSYRALAHEIGYANIDDTRAIRDCVERLWKVSIIFQRGGKRAGCRLLSAYTSNSSTGNLFVALNPYIARAIIGGGKQHVRISMGEVRALKSDPARLIHQRLCAIINPGTIKKVEINTVASYAWPEDPDNSNTMKKHRQKVRKALSELAEIGWSVDEYAAGKWGIGRPKAHTNGTRSPR